LRALSARFRGFLRRGLASGTTVSPPPAEKQDMKLKKTSILDGEEIKAVTAQLRVLMPALAEIADRMGHDLEAGARLRSLRAKCTEAREKRGLSIKEVAKQLGVPQYRIKAIEAGSLSEIDSLVMTRYVSLLGLERWARKWATANPELAAKLGWWSRGRVGRRRCPEGWP
jgi:DNA-binding XRE family transcriptional regulator